MQQQYRQSPHDVDADVPAPRVGRTWGLRILFAIGLGVALGAVVGAMGVSTLEPGNPGQADSLQLLLDSVANAKTAEEEARPAPVEPAVDTVAVADTQPGAVAVPDLADTEEGDARALLQELGFSVGQVIFRGSPKPIGTVLSSFPIAGERVTLPATINLVLSDGRGRRDSVDISIPQNR